jgi:hypothetical protein
VFVTGVGSSGEGIHYKRTPFGPQKVKTRTQREADFTIIQWKLLMRFTSEKIHSDIHKPFIA